MLVFFSIKYKIRFMDSIDIKTLKVNEFHKGYLKRIANIKFPIFSIIEFNLHGSCNRRCAFCPRVDEKLWPNKDEEFSLELFSRIVNQLKDVDYSGRISFSGFSEPTLHSKLTEILLLIKENLPKAYPEIITNGDYLNKKKLHEFFEAGLKFIYVSLYNNKQTYDKLIQLKKDLNLTDAQYSVRPRNLGSKKNFGLNLNNRAGAVDYNTFGKEIKQDFPLKQSCNYPMYTIFVDYNGDTLICPNDWDKRKIIGNVNNENILNIWNNEQFNNVRKRLLNKNRDEIPCEKCNVNGLIVGKEFSHLWEKIYK